MKSPPAPLLCRPRSARQRGRTRFPGRTAGTHRDAGELEKACEPAAIFLSLFEIVQFGEVDGKPIVGMEKSHRVQPAGDDHRDGLVLADAQPDPAGEIRHNPRQEDGLPVKCRETFFPIAGAASV